MTPDLRYDQHRSALGFLTVAQADALADSGVRVLDPFSTLISAGVATPGPNPDERGTLLKGTGLARRLVLERGEVASCQASFGDAEVVRQSCFHPGGIAPSA